MVHMATILVVDDDVSLVERIATQLTDAGYSVLRASRMPHAELLIAEQHPDLVLLDPDIGQGDGWLLLNQFAASTPIIVISGQALEEDIIRGLEAGAAGYLAKPFRTGALPARRRRRAGPPPGRSRFAPASCWHACARGCASMRLARPIPHRSERPPGWSSPALRR